ncbi:MAG TPA: MmcQ/YjbR family DNA-binding protein [Ferruginibacter sp.]|nr:MmcQ/YjbR family DNA-binding protein [Ferruginibacter sp.]
MITIETVTKQALTFKNVVQLPHFDKTSFRINGKIFATCDAKKGIASLKLTPVEQSVYVKVLPDSIYPATGAWGRQGWTVFTLKQVSKAIFTEALQKAYSNLAVTAAGKKATSQKIVETIQTLHPDKSKTNKKISVEKYSFIKTHLLAILQTKELTHTELMEALYQRVKGRFDGGVQWYGETVKLDLEARGIIERVGTRTITYRIRASKR